MIEGSDGASTPGHRAHYMREMGIWRATCRVCGWETTDKDRRQAATLFRAHIRQTKGPDPGQPLAAEMVSGGLGLAVTGAVQSMDLQEVRTAKQAAAVKPAEDILGGFLPAK